MDAPSKVTNVKADNTQNTITSPLLTLENLTTGTGASALALNVASGHAPFTTNSTTRVTNLNADEVDGLHSSSLVTTSAFRRVGPVAASGGVANLPLATIGNLSFTGNCDLGDPSVPRPESIYINITSAVNHATFGALTQSQAGGSLGAET